LKKIKKKKFENFVKFEEEIVKTEEKYSSNLKKKIRRI